MHLRTPKARANLAADWVGNVGRAGSNGYVAALPLVACWRIHPCIYSGGGQPRHMCRSCWRGRLHWLHTCARHTLPMSAIYGTPHAHKAQPLVTCRVLVVNAILSHTSRVLKLSLLCGTTKGWLGSVQTLQTPAAGVWSAAGWLAGRAVLDTGC